MTGKHYNWHKLWAIDLAACTATHDSGLVFQFTQTHDEPAAWDGQPTNINEWQASLASKMPLPDLAKHAARLAREAGDAYLYALKKRH